jgi:hypothetical protein
VIEILGWQARLQRPVPRCADVKTIALQPIGGRSLSFKHTNVQAGCDKTVSKAKAPGSGTDNHDFQIAVHAEASPLVRANLEDTPGTCVHNLVSTRSALAAALFLTRPTRSSDRKI